MDGLRMLSNNMDETPTKVLANITHSCHIRVGIFSIQSHSIHPQKCNPTISSTRSANAISDAAHTRQVICPLAIKYIQKRIMAVTKIARVGDKKLQIKLIKKLSSVISSR